MPDRERPRTASPAEAPAPFSIGDTEVPPGTLRKVEFPVARLPSGTRLPLPVAVVHGSRPGPAIWLSGAIHGDELNGIPIIRDVLARLDPTSLAGTVLAVPIVNVFGLINESRYLPDRRDLNRSFPGSARGSLAAQLAHLFTNEIVARCTGGIDLHTGSGGRTNLPQIRCDLDDEPTRLAAEAFGTPVLIHADLRDGSLRAAARARGVRVLLYEAGEAGRFDSDAIRLGREGVFRVLAHLGMTTGDTAPPRPSRVSRSSSWVRARQSGFCRLRVEPGDPVDKGQTVAEVFDALGKKDVPLAARHAGMVIGCVRSAAVHRGDAVVNVAELEPA